MVHSIIQWHTCFTSIHDFFFGGGGVHFIKSIRTRSGVNISKSLSCWNNICFQEEIHWAPPHPPPHLVINYLSLGSWSTQLKIHPQNNGESLASVGARLSLSLLGSPISKGHRNSLQTVTVICIQYYFIVNFKRRNVGFIISFLIICHNYLCNIPHIYPTPPSPSLSNLVPSPITKPS